MPVTYFLVLGRQEPQFFPFCDFTSCIPISEDKESGTHDVGALEFSI